MIFQNTKLIDLWDTTLSFFICISGCCFLAVRRGQPLATLRERPRLTARATLLLHFVLELAQDFIYEVDNIRSCNADIINDEKL